MMLKIFAKNRKPIYSQKKRNLEHVGPNCKFLIKNVPKPKTKGIVHSIPLEIVSEIKEELNSANSVKVEDSQTAKI